MTASDGPKPLAAKTYDHFRGAKDNKRNNQHGAGNDLLLFGSHASKTQRILNESKYKECIQCPAPMGGVQKDSEPNKEQDKDDRAPRDRCAGDRSKPNVLIPFREATNRTFLEDNLRDPSI